MRGILETKDMPIYNRRRLFPFACFLVLSAAWGTVQAGPSARNPRTAVVDLESGDLLLGSTCHTVHPPASTAKLATALVVVECLSPETRVEVSRRAAEKPPSKVGLRPGESWTAKDLLYALLLESGNDAACALAEAAAGSEAAFAERMTRKARALGADRTTFGNASGLPHPDNKSCARDLAVLAAAAWRDPFLRKILQTREATIRSRAGRAIPLKSHNRLLWDPEIDVVGKTGYTRASQKCFAGVLEVGGRYLGISLMGSRDLWGDLRRLVSRAARECPPSGALSVRQAQEALRKAGYDPGPVDGMMGPRTRSALSRFQRDRKLSATGRIDAATSLALRRAVGR